MNTINFRAILAVALFVACGTTAAASAPVTATATRAHAQAMTAPMAMDLPCNPLVCSVK